MKKNILSLVVAFLLTFATSCTRADGDPFLVFSADFCAEIVVTCEDSECKVVYDSAKKSIEFVLPDELSGYKLRLDNGTPYLSYGGTEIVLSQYGGRLAYIFEAAFLASAEQVSDITAQRVENKTVTVVKTEYITYTFSSDGTPLIISGYYDGAAFEMTFLSFTGAMK